MTLYDSSVLIEYLDGTRDVVEYVTERADERAVVPPIVAYEVYQGEVFGTGPADFDAVDGALQWVEVVESTRGFARAAAELQDELQRRGRVLAARDAFVAGSAMALDERLVAADDDFDVDGIRELVGLDLL